MAALALSAAEQAFAQPTAGLGARLDAAEKKLDEDIKACRPIGWSDYRALFDEANKNLTLVEKAVAFGAPIERKQVNADAKRALDLLNRAHTAAAKPCKPPENAPRTAVLPETTEPPKATLPPAPVEPGPAPVAGATPSPTVAEPATGTFSARIEEAEKKLDADIKACRPVRVADYMALGGEVNRNIKAANKAARAGAPVDTKQSDSDAARVTKILQRALKAEAGSKPAPTKQAAKDESIPKTTGAMNLNPFATDVLAAQNAERGAVGAAPLTWDPALEASATAYAQQLARIGQLVHAPREGRGIERENLQKARIGWSPERMIQDWIGEKRDFVPGNFPNVAVDGNWLNVAHYTQMIWPTTTDVGCGMAEGRGYNWFVCRYSPGGNKDGKPVGFVGAPPMGIANPTITQCGRFRFP